MAIYGATCFCIPCWSCPPRDAFAWHHQLLQFIIKNIWARLGCVIVTVAYSDAFVTDGILAPCELSIVFADYFTANDLGRRRQLLLRNNARGFATQISR